MTLGILIDDRSFASYADLIGSIDQLPPGLGSAWLGSHQSWDPLTLIAAAGSRRTDLAFGSGVALSYPQHPVALAMQALTAQAAAGGRFTLGLGTRHQTLLERVYGYSAARPAQHAREYLAVLSPLLRGETAEFHGETLDVSAAVNIPGVPAPRVLLAALGPVMLQVAGSLTDGTIVSWTTPRAIAEHVLPRVTKAAEDAGRPQPAIVAMVPVCIDDDQEGLRAWAAQRFAGSTTFPNYRAILARGGAASISDAMALGSQAAVLDQLSRLREAGATEIVVLPIGTSTQIERSITALAGWDG